MKLCIDDVRPAPEGYCWCETVMEAKASIQWLEENYKHIERMYLEGRADEDDLRCYTIELLDLDHDAGDCAQYGGDYIKLLDWLEETGRNYPIRIHSMNPVGRERMRAIIERNGWKEIK
jgi:hypothetical protein